jgi:hypothetical protein
MNQTIRVAEACQSKEARSKINQSSVNAKSARMSSHHPEPREQLSNGLHAVSYALAREPGARPASRVSFSGISADKQQPVK